jgi:hypothetical protein
MNFSLRNDRATAGSLPQRSPDLFDNESRHGPSPEISSLLWQALFANDVQNK